jgi:argininosuccinate synthase
MSNDNLKDQDLITGNGYKNESTADLREKFVNEYTAKMGWDRDNLTEEQLNEIQSQKGYQCPGMICG